MARKKRQKNEPLNNPKTYDVTKKVMTLQDIEEIVDYYKAYGYNTDVDYKAMDIVRVCHELLRLRDILEDIVNDTEEIIDNGTLEAELFEGIKKKAKKGLQTKKIH